MARAQAQQVLVARIQQLEIEQQAWQRQHAAQQDVPGARQLAAEALSTLNQLQQLYQREDQLWTYLSALEDVYSQRTHYAEAATSAANHAAAERAQLRHLEQQLQRHRPPPQSESFRFSHELPPSRPLLSSSWR